MLLHIKEQVTIIHIMIYKTNKASKVINIKHAYFLPTIHYAWFIHKKITLYILITRFFNNKINGKKLINSRNSQTHILLQFINYLHKIHSLVIEFP